MDYPQIILLNGASSSGKSTLAKELQKKLIRPYFYYSSDQLVNSNMLPDVDRVNNDTDFSWNIIRPKFFGGFQKSIAAFAASGLFLIVEHIIEYKPWLDDLVVELNPFKVLYIGVKCPIEEIDKREIKRGDRQIGEGRSHIENGIHTWSEYDLEVDTFINSPEENAALIIKFIEEKQNIENIFKSLYEKIQNQYSLSIITAITQSASPSPFASPPSPLSEKERGN